MADMKVLIACDIQIPFEDKKALELWFKVLKSYKPDQILFVGDIVDFPEYGRWEDGGPREFLNTLPPAEKADTMVLDKVVANAMDGRKFYEKVRKMAPNAEIISALGNHDVRVFNYFHQKNPSLHDQITTESIWGFDTLGIDSIMYTDRPKHMWAGIHAHHGVAISMHSGESVRKDIGNFGVSLIRGHSHRLGMYSRTFNLRGDSQTQNTDRGWEMGNLMDRFSQGASYDNVHNWQSGFGTAIVESGVEGGFNGERAHVMQHEIIDNTVRVDGKLFRV